MDEKQQVLPGAENNEITKKPELSYYEKNKELIKQKQRDSYKANRVKRLERRKELYHEKNWVAKRDYYYANKPLIQIKQKAYYLSSIKGNYDRAAYIKNKDRYKQRYELNKEHLNELQRMRHNYHYKHNGQFRIKCLLRSYINSCILWNSNSDDFQYLTGMFLPLFKQYLEYKFEPGMSWDNRKEWHIDHITPTTQYDLTQLADILKCYNYGNLVPRWSKDNLNKAASINKPQ